ncbi:unnamed protein product [Mytilus coruscus]|uniref:Uncharacterized protein n=1 Tax=Mytilus coruscus TaxID=42192 RepID=A0A6J8A9C0_MYTCO|nr:unnamed protein product [Mytilus coruscus]
MFLHSLMTGIQSDNIRQEMRPILSDTNVRDETLISSLNQIVLRDNERLAKSKGSMGKVNKIEATEESDVFGDSKEEVKKEFAEIRQKGKEESNSRHDIFTEKDKTSPTQGMIYLQERTRRVQLKAWYIYRKGQEESNSRHDIFTEKKRKSNSRHDIFTGKDKKGQTRGMIYLQERTRVQLKA